MSDTSKLDQAAITALAAVPAERIRTETTALGPSSMTRIELYYADADSPPDVAGLRAAMRNGLFATDVRVEDCGLSTERRKLLIDLLDELHVIVVIP